MIELYIGIGFTLVSLMHLMLSYLDLRPNRNDIDVLKVGLIGMAIVLTWPLYCLAMLAGFFWAHVCNLSRRR